MTERLRSAGKRLGNERYDETSTQPALPPELGPPTPGDSEDAARLEAAYAPEPSMPARHPLSARFHELLGELGELHDRKQADYGREHDPFANVRAASEWGMPGWVGAMLRATDKLRRLQAFAQSGELANESAEDSLRDIAVYALIALVLLEEAA